MSTVKVKFRPSIIDGKEGKIYYQITHNRVVRQLCTNYKIYPDEWNDDTSSIIINDESRRNHINIIKDLIDRDLSRFKIIQKKYEEKLSKPQHYPKNIVFYSVNHSVIG